MADLVRVLSIDGGGIRGIIPALVLQDIEQSIGKPIAKAFDLIAGSSTGAILALGLAVEDSDGTPLHTAGQLVQLYEQDGRRIFRSPTWRRMLHLGRVFGEKYPSSALKRVLNETFGPATLQDCVTDVLIPSYEIERGRPFFFRSRKASLQAASRDVPLVEVALAASAAPTYFAPARLGGAEDDDHLTFVDGGVFANNPAMCAFVEARYTHPGKECLVVSMGTGRWRRSMLSEHLRGWGAARWARFILGVVFDGTSSAVDYQLDHLLPHDRYFRFQVDMQAGSRRLDDASWANVRRLRADARHLLRSERRRIRDLCSMLSP